MSRFRVRTPTVRLRRTVQLLVLALFLAVVLAARPQPGQRLPVWLESFFHLDPLIPVVTGLAAHAVQWAFLLSVVTVVVTVLLGRVFCGWFCPLGTVHALVGRLFERWRPARQREHWHRGQLAKYYVLAALLVLALFGVQWLVLVDPLVILYRTLTVALWPAAQGGVESTATAIYQADPGVGTWRVTSVTEPVYRTVRDLLFVKQQQSFLNSGFVLGFFLFITGLNFVQRRFWCRYICPLGALLGLLAWRPWLVRKLDTGACNQCDLCGLTCHGAASTGPGTGWKPQECLGCLNCTSACAAGGLKFRWELPWRHGLAPERVNLSRRGMLEAAAGGVVAAMVLRASPQARGATFHPLLLRPPGAADEADFLARCTACGLCMKVCPTGGLHPTLFEAGLDGLFTPRLVPRIGYCDYECNACGQVCPTAAIRPLPLAEKKAVRLGLAAFDVGRCLPYAYGRNCMVCEEHCPVPDKAIYFAPVTVTGRDGVPTELLRPHVDPAHCTGCGICENVCPFKDQPAIRVTSANESRHAANQPILGSGSGYPF